MFDCSRPFEYVLTVNPGGGLTIGPSSTGRGSLIRPVDPRYPTRVEASWPRSVDIRELTVQDCGSGVVPAMLIDHADGSTVRDCEFRDCAVALSIRSCRDVQVVSNRFAGAWVRAIELSSVVDCTLRFNRIEGGNVGVEAQYSSGLLVRDNVLTDITIVGLSLVLVDDVAVRSNTIAMRCGRAVEVRSSKLVDVVDQPIAGPPSMPGAVSGILVQDSARVRIQDCALTGLREAVTISALFADRAESNLLLDLEMADCGIAINVSSVANMMTGCTIERCDVGVRIGPIYDDASADNRITGCELIDCDVGISLTHSRSTMVESTALRGCSSGIYCLGSPGNVASNSSVLGCSGTAIVLDGSELLAWNCTIDEGPLAMSVRSGGTAVLRQSSIARVALSAELEGGSAVELHNSTHVRAYDIDLASTMSIWWDVIVSVGYESGNRSERPGTLTVRSALGTIEISAHVPGLPWTRSIELREASHTQSEHLMHTPHLFMASTPGRTCSIEAMIDRFSTIAISIDDVPPRIVIQTPSSETSRDGRVTLSGYCVDSTSDDVAMEIHLDGDLIYEGENRWEMDVNLVDGAHSLEYVATDAGGNKARRRQPLLVDSTPPLLRMLSPPSSPFIVADSSVLISGLIVNGTGVSIDGVDQALKDGTFSTLIELPEDCERTFVIRAWDDLGNNVSMAQIVVRDMTAPALELDEHPDVTRDARMVIGGWTDPDVAKVQLDGLEVPLLPGGRFTLVLDLAEGRNAFTVAAIDAADNRGTVHVVVTLDTQAAFEVVWPPNGTVVQTTDIDVVIHGEAGAQYRVGTMAWADADSAGYCTIRTALYGSENLLSITARDLVGNLGESSVTVVYSPPVTHRESDAPRWALLIVIVTALGSIALLLLHVRVAPRRS